MKKSRRNRKSCHKTSLIAGANVSTQCSPTLTKAMRRALLDEIKNFNVGRARGQAEESARGGPAVDAYQQWREQRPQVPEPMEANPDVLAEEDGLKYMPSKKDNEMVSLLMEVRQSFSPRERQVWNLVMRHSMSYPEVADLLSCSVSAVQIYVKRARAKFVKFMEASK